MEALAKLERLQNDSSSASIHRLCKRNVLVINVHFIAVTEIVNHDLKFMNDVFTMRLAPEELSAKLTGYESTTQSHVLA